MSNKRCVDLSNKFSFDSLLAATNPQANEADPIVAAAAPEEAVVATPNDQETNPSEDNKRYVLPDSSVDGSILQAIQRPAGKLLRDDSDLFNIFKKLTTPSPPRTDNLFHGRFGSSQSFESNEPPASPASNVNYMPSTYEYLPAPQKQNYVIGPTAFKTTSMYEQTLRESRDEENLQAPAMQEVQVSKKQPPPSCHCNQEHFENLIYQMQSSYSQFHQEMSGLFDRFRAQANCGQKPAMTDSYSSYSHPKIDYSAVDSQKIPSPPAAPSENHQFLSYEEYVHRMNSVNANPKSLMSNVGNYDNQVLRAAPDSFKDSGEETVKSLKNYLKDFELAAPAPEIEESASSKDKIREQIQSLLDRFKAKAKN